MKKQICIIFSMLLIFTLLFTGCKNKNAYSREDIIKQSKILDWMEVLGKISDDADCEKDYKNIWYVYTGKINTIKEEYVVLTDLDDLYTDMKVFLDADAIKPLKIGDVIYVVGRFETPSSQEMKDAILLEKEEIEEYYVLQPFSKEGTGTESSYSYYDYVYDKEIGQIVAYSVRGNAMGTYQLEYDDKGNVLTEIMTSSIGSATTNYTYNDDGSIKTIENVESGQLYKYTHEKDKDGNIVKSTRVNAADKNDTTVFEYTYSKAGVLMKETQVNADVSRTIEYEYDRYGSLRKESCKSSAGDSTILYTYTLVDKK